MGDEYLHHPGCLVTTTTTTTPAALQSCDRSDFRFLYYGILYSCAELVSFCDKDAMTSALKELNQEVSAEYTSTQMKELRVLIALNCHSTCCEASRSYKDTAFEEEIKVIVRGSTRFEFPVAPGTSTYITDGKQYAAYALSAQEKAELLPSGEAFFFPPSQALIAGMQCSRLTCFSPFLTLSIGKLQTLLRASIKSNGEEATLINEVTNTWEFARGSTSSGSTGSTSSDNMETAASLSLGRSVLFSSNNYFVEAYTEKTLSEYPESSDWRDVDFSLDKSCVLRMEESPTVRKESPY